ncbi:MAG: hypothetical protein HOD39_18920 [Verrucomicrobia bacterium]|nr:hypothetical protein [Verrucomicrobiota bacterium]
MLRSCFARSSKARKGAIKAGIYFVAMVASNTVDYSFLDASLKRANENGLGFVAVKVARPVNPGSGRGGVHAGRIQKSQFSHSCRLEHPSKGLFMGSENPCVSAVISNMSNLEKDEANLKIPGITRES